MNDAEWEQQVTELRDIAARSVDPGLTARYIAISDSRVRKLFFQKLAEGHSFQGIQAGRPVSGSDQLCVVFVFGCADGRVCLILPSFAAVVNLREGQVVSIVNPWMAAAQASESGAPATAQQPAAQGRFLFLQPELSDGTLPLASDGTLPLAGGGTLPLRMAGYLLVPAGWGVRGG